MRQIEHLQARMRSLYQSMDYYISIPPEGGGVDYEQAYHCVTKDPDGKTRHLLEERTHALTGMAEITGFLKTLSPGRILDIGCGLGWLLSEVGSAWERHGIEISEFATQHAQSFGRIHRGTIEDYTDPKPFDVVVMNHVIEHLVDPVSALQKIKTWLKPSGKFILGTPDFDSGAARRYGERFRMLHDPTHISLFSYDSLQRCIRDLGFKIDFVEFPYFDTPWFTTESLLRMMDDQTISPPFYGSFMTFFCSLSPATPSH